VTHITLPSLSTSLRTKWRHVGTLNTLCYLGDKCTRVVDLEFFKNWGMGKIYVFFWYSLQVPNVFPSFHILELKVHYCNEWNHKVYLNRCVMNKVLWKPPNKSPISLILVLCTTINWTMIDNKSVAHKPRNQKDALLITYTTQSSALESL